jgi:hypothetical protein
MRKFLVIAFIFVFPVISFCQLKNGYEFNLTINGLRDSSVYMAYHLGDKQYIKDTVRLDKAGHGLFHGKESLPEGIYMVVLPGKRYFEFLVTGNQHFGMTCSYSDFFNTLKFNGSEENTAFVAYQKKWVSLQQKANDIAKRANNNKQNPDSLRILNAYQKQQEETMKNYLRSVEKENEGSFLGVLVKAMLPVEIPEFNIPAGFKNPDSVRWMRTYIYNKEHYFDNLSLTDERLLRTPLLYSRLESFFSNVLIQAPDTINKEIDRLIKKCSSNHKIFQFVSVFLFNHFRESQIMGHDAVMVKIADDIYLSGKADWITKEFRDDLKKQIDMVRPNLIGKKAQNLVMDSYKGIFVSLDDVEKDYTILYFWEPDCGHCKEATPKLKTWYDTPKNYSAEVFAVCTTSDKDKWAKYIEEHKLTWINGWDPQRSSHFDYYFNVNATPTVYILDRKKKIIAKKLAVEEIGPFIDSYRKYSKSK